MTFPQLGSPLLLLLSFTLAAPPLLAEDGDSPDTPPPASPSPSPSLIPSPPEEKPAGSSASPQEKMSNSTPRTPPAFLLPNRAPRSSSSRLRTNPPSSVVSSALRESFRYDPSLHTPESSAADSSGSDDPAAYAADSDVVMLPKVAVNERPLPRDLGADIARWRSQAPQNHSRFGTGIHEKDFGKVRVGVMTLFYIPIAVGVKW